MSETISTRETMFGEENLCHSISGVTSEVSDKISNYVHGELMELASMLYDLDVHTVKALAKLLNVYFDGENYSFDPPDCLDDYSDKEKPPIKLSDRRLAVAATKRKNNVSE